jgi:hypothetical protein
MSRQQSRTVTDDYKPAMSIDGPNFESQPQQSKTKRKTSSRKKEILPRNPVEDKRLEQVFFQGKVPHGGFEPFTITASLSISVSAQILMQS